MNKAMPWVATAALLVAAWCVQLLAPSEDAAMAPFIVSAEVGEHATGRNIEVIVRDVRATRVITTADGWRAEGTWVLVHLDASAVSNQNGASFHGATLIVHDREYRATERFTTLFRSTTLVPGIPKAGSLAFEVPEDSLTGTGILQLSTSADTRLDSVIEVRIPLDSLSVSAEEQVVETDWAKR